MSSNFCPIDQKFCWWLSTVCSRDVDTRLYDHGSLLRYDEKLEALESWDGMTFRLFYWEVENGKVKNHRPAFAYRLSKRMLELVPIDEETGEIDDGDPLWTFNLVEFKRVEYDLETAANYLR